jgi:hypothetical protein
MNYDKLVQFYRAYNLIPSSLTDEELAKYYKLMDSQDNLIVECDSEGEIIGFCEIWRINYDQLGRIMVHGVIDARHEDTVSGSICFVANLAILPYYRMNGVFDLMKHKFFIQNYNCEYFCGDSRRRSHHHTFNLYKRNEFIQKFNKGVEHE